MPLLNNNMSQIRLWDSKSEEDILSPALSDLAELVGDEILLKIAERFQGEAIYIPKRIGRWNRDQRIFNDFRHGIPSREIAHKYGLSVSRVNALLSERG